MSRNYKPSTKKGFILILTIPYRQLFIENNFQDCQENFDNDKPAFLSLLENHIDLDEMAIDSAKADMTVFDSSDIEAFVIVNNSKYVNCIIRQLKAYAKSMGFDKKHDPYKAAYGTMPSHASANPEIKQLYINGYFCYVFKFGFPNTLCIKENIHISVLYIITITLFF